MTSDEFLSTEILRYGAYLCIRARDAAGMRALAKAAIPLLADQIGLQNEFDPGDPHRDSIAFLRRHTATAADLWDEAIQQAHCVIHVASRYPEPVAEFSIQAQKLLEPGAEVRILAGVVRPRNYTGAAMKNFAYARAVSPQPGPVMPNGFLIPMIKTAEWWQKDWMERHTYFLPQYDSKGRMVAEGHALAAAAGIPCIYRRTYHAAASPADAGSYDFLTYFECADSDIAVFREICRNLRDANRNPEWKFVREGPTWHGRRVATWDDVFADA